MKVETNGRPVTLDSQNITNFQSKHVMEIVDNMDVNCGMYYTFMEENSTFIEKLSTFMEDYEKSCPRMRFLCFRAVWIRDGYNLSG